MARSALTPVFVGLRTGLHLLVVGLIVFVVARAVLVPSEVTPVVIVFGMVFAVTYALGGLVAPMAGHPRSGVAGRAWLALVVGEWVGLLWLSPDAAYLVFPLFFLLLHVLGRVVGTLAVLAATVVAIVALGASGGWSVGGVVGPLVGAGVALLIGVGYAALAREAAEQKRLLEELVATRDRLAATERESGVLAERARLAREIHDTVAQGLSSIQMLLHATERVDPERPGIDYVRLARETAAANLADTRRFIRELTPPDLDDRGLAGALRRLAETQWEPHGVAVTVRVSDVLAVPMHLQTALIRITQGAMANVIQHARARTATITLTTVDDDLRLVVSDDGRGFEPGRAREARDGGRTDSFGLQATRERIDQLGGVLTIDSAPGHGTTLTVDLAMSVPA